MTLRDALAALPDEAQVTITVNVRELSEALAKRAGEDEPRYVTTTWLAEHEGLSADWWAEKCREGCIPGAWQDRQARDSQPGSPWYLPLEAARAYLFRRITTRNSSRSKSRGPYRRAS